ncbi:hypothetical protein [Paenibacillus aceti]|uniref:Uncharacterized protein n=1 Tax=Paenibacillus aceti TaxID=1820010 RepID=A0ABQ1W4W3_9BACL|nr:hypothetical protein [Paenibacillus aceti]GGG11568.1 hypothetical protein GCM10010913_36760 [Paenibacillus aceti]
MKQILTFVIIIIACILSIFITFYNYTPKKISKTSIKISLKRNLIISVRYFWSNRSGIAKIAFIVFLMLPLIGTFLLVQNHLIWWLSIITSVFFTTFIMYSAIIYYNFWEKLIDYYFSFTQTKSRDIPLLSLMLPLLPIGYQLTGIIHITTPYSFILLICMYINHITIFKYMFYTINVPGFIPKSINGNYKVALMWLINLLVTLYAEIILINELIPNSYIDSSAVQLLLIALNLFIANDTGRASSIWGEFQNLLIAISGVYFLVVFLASLLTTNNNKKSVRRVSIRRPNTK